MEKTLAVVSRIIGAIIAVLFLSYFWWQTSQHVGANLPPVVQKLNSLLPRQQVADTDEQSIAVPASQDRRQTILTEMCAKYFSDSNETSGPYPNAWSSDKQQFLLCMMPKVACSSWKHVLLEANGAPDHISIHSDQVYRYVDRFDTLSPVAQQRVLKYFKFIFVRHPFERLVSAHTDKFVNPKNRGAWLTVADDIKRKYRKAMRHDDPVTFREFVQYLVDPRTVFDQHWRPMYQLCQPCRIHYDFIGHTETMEEDSRYALSRLGIDVDLFPHYNVHNSSDRVTEALAQLTESEVQRFVEVYRPDFDLFGYSVDLSQIATDE